MALHFHLLSCTPEDKQLPSLVRGCAMMMAAVVLLQIFSYGPHFPQMLYYGILFLLNVVVLGKLVKEGIKINGTMFAFWGMMWISILANWGQIPPVYQPVLRTIAFGGLILAVGPFFQSPLLLAFRRHLLQWMNLGLWAMTMLSFIGYVLHFLPTDRQGFYLGCTGHSMILGALAGFTGITCLHEALRPENTPKRQKLFLVMFLASIIVTVLAASRVSFGSLGCAALIYGALSFRGRMAGGLKVVMTLAIIGMIILQFTGEVSGAITSKMHTSDVNEEYFQIEGEDTFLQKLTASRMSKWNDRINEIAHEPIFGVGAHSVRPEYCSGEDAFSNGQIEPGNGWLYVFSSMGIIAFVLFCYIILKPILIFWSNGLPGTDSCLLLGQLVFFAVYMNAEAHITAAGDFTCFYCWLVIAVAQYPDKNHLNQRVLQLLPAKI